MPLGWMSTRPVSSLWAELVDEGTTFLCVVGNTCSMGGQNREVAETRFGGHEVDILDVLGLKGG